MALRTKTIEYAFDSNRAGLAAATRLDLTATTLFIPENTSRTFRSVIIEVNCHDNAATAASITSWLIGIKLGAAAFSDVTVTSTVTHSGEHQALVFTRDVTSYFNTNFGSGTSQTCQVGMQFGGITTANHSVKLYITYEWDDTSQTTRVKTVRIPCDGNTTTLTAALANVGSATEIPALDSFLPESSKVYRAIWFELIGNDCTAAVTTYSLAVALDAEAEVNFVIQQAALNSAIWSRKFWRRDNMTTNATHNLKARGNNLTGRFGTLVWILHVTYEYDHSASSTLMNSLVIPLAEEAGFAGGTGATDQSRAEQTIWVAEPTTITLAQSGYVLYYNAAGGIASLITNAGSQATRTYTHTTGTVVCGAYCISKRVDSGGVNGAGMTLARGKNTITVNFYTTNANNPATNVSAILYLNYTSGKASAGDGAHNHSTFWSVLDTPATTQLQRYESAAVAPNIPETDYFVTGVGYHLLMIIGGQDTAIALTAELLSGEGPADGWEQIYGSSYDSAVERAVSHSWARARLNFRRWPGDTQDTDRLALESTRKYRLEIVGPSAAANLAASTGAVFMVVTYHAITFTVSGTISGSGGGTVNVDVFRVAADEWIGATSRSGNGVYSLTWYDDTAQVYAVAREDATHMGRSDDGLAS